MSAVHSSSGKRSKRKSGAGSGGSGGTDESEKQTPAASASSAASQASSSSSLAGLPEALLRVVVGFLPQWDVGTLLQLSKECQGAVLPAMHELDLLNTSNLLDQDALRSLLERMSNLHRLHASAEMGELRRLVGWIGDGSWGQALRSCFCLGLSLWSLLPLTTRQSC